MASLSLKVCQYNLSFSRWTTRLSSYSFSASNEMIKLITVSIVNISASKCGYSRLLVITSEKF